MKFSTQNPKKSLHLVSLGCTKNLVDSEIMLGKLKDYTMTNDASTADVIIVNTCGFIDSAKQESLNTILNLHNERKKESVLVMAGCRHIAFLSGDRISDQVILKSLRLSKNFPEDRY